MELEIIWLSLCLCMVFAFFDYVGFNNMRSSLPLYRGIQTVFQAALATGTYFLLGFWPAFGFLFLWWFWISDWFYYLLFTVLKWYLPELAGSIVATEVFGDQVTWAWWTPVGLAYFGLDNIGGQPWIKRSIPGWVLLTQSVWGIITLATLVAVFA